MIAKTYTFKKGGFKWGVQFTFMGRLKEKFHILGHFHSLLDVTQRREQHTKVFQGQNIFFGIGSKATLQYFVCLFHISYK